MIEQPILYTERLTLRPFTLADAADVQRLAGAYEVASTTATIPHPYEDGMAETWIETHPQGLAEGTGIVYAITRRDTGTLCGAIGLGIKPEHQRAELGYWIGVPYWGRGYCTEAAAALRDRQADLVAGRIAAGPTAPLQENDLSIGTGAGRAPEHPPLPTCRAVRVVVGHATPVIRRGIGAILAAATDIAVVGEAASGSELQWLVQEEAPDVLVVDANMKGISSGVILRQLGTDAPALPVLAVVDHVAEEAICAAVRASVGGCLLVDEPPERIIAAVRAVARGKRGWFSRPVAEVLARRVQRGEGKEETGGGKVSGKSEDTGLTVRECEVLSLLGEGFSNIEIAQGLHVSQSTVRFHLRNVYGKLGVRGRGAAIVWAVRNRGNVIGVKRP